MRSGAGRAIWPPPQLPMLAQLLHLVSRAAAGIAAAGNGAMRTSSGRVANRDPLAP